MCDAPDDGTISIAGYIINAAAHTMHSRGGCLEETRLFKSPLDTRAMGLYMYRSLSGIELGIIIGRPSKPSKACFQREDEGKPVSSYSSLHPPLIVQQV